METVIKLAEETDKMVSSAEDRAGIQNNIDKDETIQRKCHNFNTVKSKNLHPGSTNKFMPANMCPEQE